MTDVAKSRIEAMLARRAITDASHAESTRVALLEHARMGRSVPQGTPERGVVWVTPAEIFARYGLDEFGRPLPGAADAPVTLEAEAGRQE